MQTITQILFDPVWLGVLIGALTIVVTIAAIFVPLIQQRKSVTFDYTAGLHDDEVILAVWNDGNIPILKDDYIDSQPLKFYLLGIGNSSITEVTIEETQPAGLRDKIQDKYKWDANSVSLGPLVLNSYYAIKLKIKLSGPAIVKIKGDIWIVGVNDPKLVERKTLAFWVGVFILIYLILFELLIFTITSNVFFPIFLTFSVFIGTGFATFYLRLQTDLNHNPIRPPIWYFTTVLKFYLGSLFIGLVPLFILQIIVHLLQHK